MSACQSGCFAAELSLRDRFETQAHRPNWTKRQGSLREDLDNELGCATVSPPSKAQPVALSRSAEPVGVVGRELLNSDARPTSELLHRGGRVGCFTPSGGHEFLRFIADPLVPPRLARPPGPGADL
jgi:hypothetical protein